MQSGRQLIDTINYVRVSRILHRVFTESSQLQDAFHQNFIKISHNQHSCFTPVYVTLSKTRIFTNMMHFGYRRFVNSPKFGREYYNKHIRIQILNMAIRKREKYDVWWIRSIALEQAFRRILTDATQGMFFISAKFCTITFGSTRSLSKLWYLKHEYSRVRCISVAATP